MSKKSQSRKGKRQQRRASTTSAKTASRAESAEDFKPDYSQTIKDLKRIGILASSFFIILVTLAIFLR